jgi:hypothetical protein
MTGSISASPVEKNPFVRVFDWLIGATPNASGLNDRAIRARLPVGKGKDYPSFTKVNSGAER